MKPKDITGQRFGRLIAVDINGKSKGGNLIWFCLCDCGNSLSVLSGNLLSSHTQSCGCLKREMASKAKTIHGFYFDKFGKRSKLSRVWSTMKERCENHNSKAYKNYGGRGISICAEWLDFEPFCKWATKNGYKEGLTIERKDNDGNYCPENCTWISKRKQSHNKRNNFCVFYNGEKVALIKLTDKRGLKHKKIYCRVKKLGWNIEKALSIP